MVEERYLSFDETMKALGVTEDDLLNLVAANEIRAFRIDREMKFKQSDVQAMAKKAGAGSDDVISIEDAGAVLVDVPEEVDLQAAADTIPATAEDVVLLDEEVEQAAPAAATEAISLEDEGEGTVVLSDDMLDADDESATQTQVALSGAGEPEVHTEMAMAPTGSEGLGTEEIVFEDEDLAIGSLDDSSFGTQEITVKEAAIDDADVTVADEDLEPTIQENAVGGSSGARRSASVSAKASAKLSARRRQIAIVKTKGNPVMLAFLAITVLSMFYPLGLYVSLMFQGFTTQPCQNTSGPWAKPGEFAGQVPEYGVVVVPGQFAWTRNNMAPDKVSQSIGAEADNKWSYNRSENIEWWGRPGNYDPNALPDTKNPAPDTAPAPTAPTPNAGGEQPAGDGQKPADNAEQKAPEAPKTENADG